jgi:outer membrane protein TolC
MEQNVVRMDKFVILSVSGNGGSPLRKGWRWAFFWLGLVLLLAGCTTSYHRKDADKEVYKIIEQAEQEVFGKTSPFTVDTRYSGKKPDEVLAKELIQERQQPDTLFLTLEDALDLAVKNSREYQTEKEQLYLKALSLTGARYQFTPHFFATSKGSFERSSTGEEVFAVNNRVGVSQLLKSGGNLGASLANDFLRYYTGDPNKSLVSLISVNLAQPLLRGFGNSIAAEGLKQAERNVIYGIRSYSQYQRQFAVNVVAAYFELLRNKDQLRNAYADYQRRLETIKYTEARGEAGKIKQLEVDEAKTEEYTAKNSYIAAATTYRNNLDRLKLTLGLPLTTRIQLDDRSLENLKAAGMPPLRFDPDKALESSIEHQLELLNAIDRFEDSKRKVKVAANQLKADLNIFADASLASEGPTDYTKFDFDNVRAGAGIELDLPIDRFKERNDYRATLVDFESAIRTLSQALDTKKDQIDRGLRNLESLRLSYDIQENAVKIAERRVTGEQVSLQAGRSTVRQVRDAQDSLVQSQNNLTEVLVRHLQAKIQLFVDIGILDTDVEQFWIRPDAVLIPLEQIQQPKEKVAPAEEIVPPEKVFEL